MEPVATTDAAPTQSEVTPPPAAPEPTPIESAVASGDMAAFREAKRTERTAPKVEPVKVDEPAVAAAKVEEARTISKRQEKINDYERQLAETRAELADLRARVAPAPRSEPAPVAPALTADPSDPEPDAADTTKYPDGPYDAKFIKDLGKWAGRQEYRAQEADAQTRAKADARTATLADREKSFRDRLATAKAADPDFLSKCSADVRALKPFHRLEKDELPSVDNAIAEEVMRSDTPDALMLHLSQPDVLTRLRASKDHNELVRAIARIELDLAKPPAEVIPTKTVSSAPPPAPTLGSRPTEGTDAAYAAVVNDDVAAYRAARLRERTANLR